MTEVARRAQVEVPAGPWDPAWAGVVRVDTGWRDVAPAAGSLGAIAGAAWAGFVVSGGPVGLVGAGTAAFAAVVAAHKVAWLVGRSRPVGAPQRVLPGPVPAPVAVAVEVLAVEGPVSEPWPGVHVEGAPRYA